MIAARVLLVLALGLTACKKDEGGQPAAGGGEPTIADPMTDPEAERGRAACAAFVAGVCSCARTLRDGRDERWQALGRDCETAPARLEALELNVRGAMAEGNATIKDRAALVANSRKIMRACVEETAKLAARGCPAADGEATAPTPPAIPPE